MTRSRINQPDTTLRRHETSTSLQGLSSLPSRSKVREKSPWNSQFQVLFILANSSKWRLFIVKTALKRKDLRDKHSCARHRSSKVKNVTANGGWNLNNWTSVIRYSWDVSLNYSLLVLLDYRLFVIHWSCFIIPDFPSPNIHYYFFLFNLVIHYSLFSSNPESKKDGLRSNNGPRQFTVLWFGTNQICHHSGTFILNLDSKFTAVNSLVKTLSELSRLRDYGLLPTFTVLQVQLCNTKTVCCIP